MHGLFFGPNDLHDSDIKGHLFWDFFPNLCSKLSVFHSGDPHQYKSQSSVYCLSDSDRLQLDKATSQLEPGVISVFILNSERAGTLTRRQSRVKWKAPGGNGCCLWPSDNSRLIANESTTFVFKGSLEFLMQMASFKKISDKLRRRPFSPFRNQFITFWATKTMQFGHILCKTLTPGKTLTPSKMS